MTEGQHSETLARMMLSDERPFSTYHDAGACWELIEFMLTCLKKSHKQFDAIESLANQIKAATHGAFVFEGTR